MDTSINCKTVDTWLDGYAHKLQTAKSYKKPKIPQSHAQYRKVETLPPLLEIETQVNSLANAICYAEASREKLFELTLKLHQVVSEYRKPQLTGKVTLLAICLFKDLSNSHLIKYCWVNQGKIFIQKEGIPFTTKGIRELINLDLDVQIENFPNTINASQVPYHFADILNSDSQLEEIITEKEWVNYQFEYCLNQIPSYPHRLPELDKKTNPSDVTMTLFNESVVDKDGHRYLQLNNSHFPIHPEACVAIAKLGLNVRVGESHELFSAEKFIAATKICNTPEEFALHDVFWGDQFFSASFATLKMVKKIYYAPAFLRKKFNSKEIPTLELALEHLRNHKKIVRTDNLVLLYEFACRFGFNDLRFECVGQMKLLASRDPFSLASKVGKWTNHRSLDNFTIQLKSHWMVLKEHHFPVKGALISKLTRLQITHLIIAPDNVLISTTVLKHEFEKAKKAKKKLFLQDFQYSTTLLEGNKLPHFVALSIKGAITLNYPKYTDKAFVTLKLIQYLCTWDPELLVEFAASLGNCDFNFFCPSLSPLLAKALGCKPIEIQQAATEKIRQWVLSFNEESPLAYRLNRIQSHFNHRRSLLDMIYTPAEGYDVHLYFRRTKNGWGMKVTSNPARVSVPNLKLHPIEDFKKIPLTLFSCQGSIGDQLFKKLVRSDVKRLVLNDAAISTKTMEYISTLPLTRLDLTEKAATPLWLAYVPFTVKALSMTGKDDFSYCFDKSMATLKESMKLK